MKREVVLFSLILLSLSISGQVHYVGLQGGLNISNISSKEDFTKNSESRKGFSGGLNYEFISAKNFTVGADLLYIQQGYKSDLILMDEMGNPLVSATTKDYYNFLSLPVKAGYQIGNRLKGFAKIGINTAFLLRAKAVYPLFNDQYQVSGEYLVINTIHVKKIDFSGIIELGTGYELNKNVEIVVLAGYRHSFTKFTNPVYFEAFNMKHYAIYTSVGIKFKLK